MRDLNDYEVVEAICRNKNCELHNYTDMVCCCIFEFLAGHPCNFQGKSYVLKKKKRWVPCTKENTKVGDTIKYTNGFGEESFVTVKYILNTCNHCIVETDSGHDGFVRLKNYEIEVEV